MWADPHGLQQARNDVCLWLMAKLAALIRRGKRIGEVAYMWAKQPVGRMKCSVIYSCGGHEQELPLSQDDGGSEWFPIIYVDPAARCSQLEKVPMYCPALAWQNARPWLAHVSRIRDVETPGVIIEELSDTQSISSVCSGFSLVRALFLKCSGGLFRFLF